MGVRCLLEVAQRNPFVHLGVVWERLVAELMWSVCCRADMSGTSPMLTQQILSKAARTSLSCTNAAAIVDLPAPLMPGVWSHCEQPHLLAFASDAVVALTFASCARWITDSLRAR